MYPGHLPSNSCDCVCYCYYYYYHYYCASNIWILGWAKWRSLRWQGDNYCENKNGKSQRDERGVNYDSLCSSEVWSVYPCHENYNFYFLAPFKFTHLVILGQFTPFKVLGWILLLNSNWHEVLTISRSVVQKDTEGCYKEYISCFASLLVYCQLAPINDSPSNICEANEEQLHLTNLEFVIQIHFSSLFNNLLNIIMD